MFWPKSTLEKTTNTNKAQTLQSYHIRLGSEPRVILEQTGPSKVNYTDKILIQAHLPRLLTDVKYLSNF